MTTSIDRRHALALMGAGAAATAIPPGGLAMTPARPWLATPAQVAGERMLLELLKDPVIARIQAEVRAKLVASPRARTIPDAARTLDGAIAQWTNSLIFGEMAKNTANPAFLWGTDDTPREWLGHRIGGVGTSGDNPDAIYRTAGIEGGGRYEITGRYHRDSRPAQVLIEVHAADIARPGAMMAPKDPKGGSGKSPDPHAATQISQDQFVVDADGAFRITLGPSPAGAGGERDDSPNHLVIPAEKTFCTLGVRDILSDWKQRAASLTLRRLDKVKPAPWGIEQVRALVHRDLADYIGFWSKFPDIWFGGLKPNTHSPPQARPGGWGFVAGLNYSLAADEALLVTIAPSGAKYTGFQVIDPWMIAPDARAGQVCLNISQSVPNSDGTVTYAIAASDPGWTNWLDTAGCRDGYAIIRWQAIPPGLGPDGLIRSFRVVKLAELAKELRIRGGTTYAQVTPQQRKARVAARKGEYETRVR